MLTAQRLRRKVLIRYKSLSSNRTRQRRIHPYHVFNHRGDWYVAAWDEPRQEVRIFALHRIRRATPSRPRATRSPATSASRPTWPTPSASRRATSRWRSPIRFAPRQARWIRERRWHKSARVQEELNGGLVLHLKIAETSEIKRWVLQFGAEAEVLKPASLRRAVAEELAAAAKPYRGRKGK